MSSFWLGVVLILSCILPPALSWGDEGHYATCKIAEGLLTEEATSAVKALLPGYANGDLASLCSWPDEIKRRPGWGWSAALHFSDTPDYACNYDYGRDCHDFAGKKNGCVSGAIYNYSAQLGAYQHPSLEARFNLTEALLFLSHFMGDIHQPLHMGFLGDKGGNSIIVHWYRQKSNLHRVWDDMIIDTALEKYYNLNVTTMVQSIQSNISKDWSTIIPSWEDCGFNQAVCPSVHASESIKLACKFSYPNATQGSTLGDEYFLSRLPIVEERIAQGGVRLAAALNRIFLGSPAISAA